MFLWPHGPRVTGRAAQSASVSSFKINVSGLKGADVYFSVWDGAGQVQSITASKYGTRADGSVALIAKEAAFLFFFFPEGPPPTLSLPLLQFVHHLWPSYASLFSNFTENFAQIFFKLLRRISHMGKSQMERLFMVWIHLVHPSVSWRNVWKVRQNFWLGDGVDLMSDTQARAVCCCLFSCRYQQSEASEVLNLHQRTAGNEAAFKLTTSSS